MFNFIINWFEKRKLRKEARRLVGIEQQVERDAFIAERIHIAKEKGKALARKT